MIKANKTINKLSDKKNFETIDIFRVICALAVLMLHLGPLSDVNTIADYWLGQVLTRLCVPFFFITSGFFLQPKIREKDKVKKYVYHLSFLYLIYTILYLPPIVYLYVKSGSSFIHCLLSFFRKLLLVGSHTHLWYFVGLIVSTIILYLLVTVFKLSNKKISIIVVLLYVIGVVGNAYPSLISELPIIGFFYDIYIKIFVTTRNGLFFGLPYLYIGYILKEKSDRIKFHHYGIYGFIFFLLMNFEAFLARNYFNESGQDMLLFLMPTTICMFLAISFKNIPTSNLERAKHYRKSSVLIYGLHLIVEFYLFLLFKYVFKIEIHSLVNFAFTLIITVIIGEAIIWLSNKKKFQWLKCLY